MNKKPPELHLIDGTTPRKGMPTQMPQSIRKRIPSAEWLNNPDAWNKEKFIEETANFLFEVYGIGNDQDKHMLSILADHIETYVNCTRSIKKNKARPPAASEGRTRQRLLLLAARSPLWNYI